MARTSAERPTCFYCDALITKNLTGDHFPIPLVAGGVEVVPCCVSCHDMKDRFKIDAWPSEWVAKVVADFPRLSRETKLFLAKALRLYAETVKSKYARAPVTGRHHIPKFYERKFVDVLKMCAGAEPGNAVCVSYPEALGETYGEMVESLSRLAKADLLLKVTGGSCLGEEHFATPERMKRTVRRRDG